MKDLNKNFPKAIMFHHFHDNYTFKKSQGSICKDQFYNIIKIIGKKNILNPNDFYERLISKKLTKHEICFTFDDGLKCQYKIAVPILEDLNIKALFFINTSIYDGNYMMLEVFRYFRSKYFKNIDEFYKIFFNNFNKNTLDIFFQKNKGHIKNKLKLFTFYSLNDIKFRMIRDYLLNEEDYFKIMKNMFRMKNFKTQDINKLLYISKKELRDLDKIGHSIGLHSHNHPIRISQLSYDEQSKEYKKNILILSKLLSTNSMNIKFMSHPYGDYNQNTFKILKRLDIKMGFCRNLEKKSKSNLEIARVNHANLIINKNL